MCTGKSCRGCFHFGNCDEQDSRDHNSKDKFGSIENEYGFKRSDSRYGDPDWRERDDND